MPHGWLINFLRLLSLDQRQAEDIVLPICIRLGQKADIGQLDGVQLVYIRSYVTCDALTRTSGVTGNPEGS